MKKRLSKRMSAIDKMLVAGKIWKLDEAIEHLKRMPKIKFDPTVSVSIILGVDPKKPEHMVRGTFVLPHVLGEGIKVCVVCGEENIEQAISAGADVAGGLDVIEKIKEGWLGFDVLLATPDMMRGLSVLGRILGPRNLMPSPKSGTIVTNVSAAVKEFKSGKVSFKMDKQRVVHAVVGKNSSEAGALAENTISVFRAIQRAKPVSAKGKYMKKAYISATMGAGLQLDLSGLL